MTGLSSHHARPRGSRGRAHTQFGDMSSVLRRCPALAPAPLPTAPKATHRGGITVDGGMSTTRCCNGPTGPQYPQSIPPLRLRRAHAMSQATKCLSDKIPAAGPQCSHHSASRRYRPYIEQRWAREPSATTGGCSNTQLSHLGPLLLSPIVPPLHRYAAKTNFTDRDNTPVSLPLSCRGSNTILCRLVTSKTGV